MKYQFQATASKSTLRSIREFVRESLGKHDVSDLEVNMVILAIDEVCSNLIIHNHTATQPLKLGLEIHSVGVHINIIDQGGAFDLLKHADPALEELVAQKKKGGLGIMLVKRIMDRIECTNKGGINNYYLYKEFNH